MSYQRIHILNTSIDNLSLQETLQEVIKSIKTNKQLHHTVVNAGKIVSLQKDARLRKSVNQADLINADGQAVVWASRILRKPLKERVPGIDLFLHLLAMADKNGYKIYLLGAKQEVLDQVEKLLTEEFSPNLIAGKHHGYFSKGEEQKVVDEIAASKAQLLFVAMSSPKKEIFINTHKKAWQNLNFIMGVGGSFDVLAGKTKRAPQWLQKIGMEWSFRLFQEPRRMWRRYLIGNTKFISLLIKEKFGK